MLPPPRPSPRGGGGDGFASLAIFGSLRFALLALSGACFACLLVSLGWLLLCWVVLDACALVVVLNCLLWPLGVIAAICCLPWPIPLPVSLSACHAACFGRLPQVLAMSACFGRLPQLLGMAPALAVFLSACHTACFGRLPHVLAMPPASAVFLSCLAWPLLWPPALLLQGRMPCPVACHSALTACCALPLFGSHARGTSILICWLWTSCATGSLLIHGRGRVDQGGLVGQGFRSIQARARGK